MTFGGVILRGKHRIRLMQKRNLTILLIAPSGSLSVINGVSK